MISRRNGSNGHCRKPEWNGWVRGQPMIRIEEYSARAIGLIKVKQIAVYDVAL